MAETFLLKSSGGQPFGMVGEIVAVVSHCPYWGHLETQLHWQFPANIIGILKAARDHSYIDLKRIGKMNLNWPERVLGWDVP